MAATAAAAKDLLAKLVAFDTTSHKTNLPLVRFVETYLRQHGVESTLVPTPDGEKASLRPVKVGRTLGDDREITEGLNGGDTVVVSPPESLADGARIKPKAAEAESQ